MNLSTINSNSSLDIIVFIFSSYSAGKISSNLTIIQKPEASKGSTTIPFSPAVNFSLICGFICEKGTGPIKPFLYFSGPSEYWAATEEKSFSLDSILRNNSWAKSEFLTFKKLKKNGY